MTPAPQSESKPVRPPWTQVVGPVVRGAGLLQELRSTSAYAVSSSYCCLTTWVVFDLLMGAGRVLAPRVVSSES